MPIKRQTPAPAYDLPYIDERRSTAILRRDKAIHQMILSLKCRRDDLALSTLISQLHQVYSCTSWKPTLIVPVPLSDERLAQRGYNQAELLAQGLSTWVHVPCRSVLKRIHDTPTQRGLDATARRQNVAGAFVTTVSMRGQRVVIIDDMVTSGATLSECAKVLRQNGAQKVYALTVASGYITAKQAQRPSRFKAGMIYLSGHRYLLLRLAGRVLLYLLCAVIIIVLFSVYSR